MTKEEKLALAEDHKTFAKIDLVKKLVEGGKIEEAEKLMFDIYNSIPHPKEGKRMGNPVFVAIVNFYESIGKLEAALPYVLKETDYLKEKIKTEKTLNSRKFIFAGKIYFHLQDYATAREYFKLAYKLEKKSTFKSFNPEFLDLALMNDKTFENYSPKQNIPEEEDIEEQLETIIETANELLDEEDYNKAIEVLAKGLKLITNPNIYSDEYEWLSATIGDAYFELKDYDNALKAFYDNYNSVGPDANPFVLLRIGQCFHQLENTQKATEFLLQAYMLEGKEIFDEEEEYFQFLGSQVEL